MFLKQSTAITIQIGPFLDDTDGVTPETGLTITQADVRLSKAGAAFAQKNDSNSATHDENGYYRCPLDTTDTNTVGVLTIAVTETGAVPVWDRFVVLPGAVYDSLIGGTDTLTTDVTQWNGTNVATPTTAGVPEVDVTYVDGSAVSTSSAQIGVNVVQVEGADPTDTIGDAVADEVIEGAHTLRHLMRVIVAFVGGKCSGGATTSIAFRDQADSKDRISMTVDGDGDRSAVTIDGT